MNTKAALILGASIIVGSMALGLLTTRPHADSNGGQVVVGRYQIAGVPGHAFVLDTATGRVWEKFVPESSFETGRFRRVVVEQSEPLLNDVSDAEEVRRVLEERERAESEISEPE